MKRRILLAISFATAIAVFAFSMLPEQQKFKTTGIRTYPLQLGDGSVLFVNPHRIAHWIAFGLITAVFTALARSARVRIAIGIAVLAFAWTIEWAEDALYRSGFEVTDVWDDAGGIATALLAVEVTAQVTTRSRRKA